METILDLKELVDNSPIGRFHLKILFFSILILFVEGVDYNAMNVSGPAILRAFHVQKSQMGVVFGWGFFGILIGSLVFGYVGDRWGRRTGAISGCLAFTLPALLSPLAASLEQLMFLRFLAGLGIGGVIPNTIALLNETAPKQYRTRFVLFAFVGYSLGNAAIASSAARLIPNFGWKAIFVVAGVSGTLLSILLAFVLPESILFVALKYPDSEKLLQLVRNFDSHLAGLPEARFMSRKENRNFSLGLLFAEGRSITTPLLWIGYFAEALTYMTLQSWFPVLLETLGFAPARASAVFSYVSLGGLAALVLISKPLDRAGPILGAYLGALAIATILLLGTTSIPKNWIVPLAILAGASGTATHNVLNGIVGLFYPTSIRSNGVGFASGMGRVAGIIGPVFTGYFLSAKLPLLQVLFVIAAPYILVVLVFFLLARIYRRQFSSEVNPAASSVSVGSDR